MHAVFPSSRNDLPGWRLLAESVEPLFGPMVNDPGFNDGLKQAIDDGRAFCVRTERSDQPGALLGGIIISTAANEILWLAVAQESRGKGIGKALMAEAVGRLKPGEPITVTTFDDTVEAGRPARALYRMFGFRDAQKGERNPAGIPTVIMRADYGANAMAAFTRSIGKTRSSGTSGSGTAG